MRTRRFASPTVFLFVVAVIACLPAYAAGAKRSQGGLRSATYPVNAKGAPAIEANRWTVRFPLEYSVGTVTGIVRCGNAGFLVDVANGTVYRVDLPSGTVRGRIGKGRFDQPAAITADCEGDRLYVVDFRAVFALRISDGEVVRKYTLPAHTFSLHGMATLDDRRQALFLSVFLAPEERNTNPVERIWEGSKLGLRLSLGDGKVDPLIPPLEVGCRNLSFGCRQISVAVASGAEDARIVVSQGHSRNVQVSRPDGTGALLVKITSPLFWSDRSDGRNAGLRSDWGTRNSYVDSVVVFGGTIATTHVRNRNRHDSPGFGRHVVLMNLHSLRGEPLACDIALPGIPMGHDRESLYIADDAAKSLKPGEVDIVRIVPGARSFATK